MQATIKHVDLEKQGNYLKAVTREDMRASFAEWSKAGMPVPLSVAVGARKDHQLRA